MDEALREKSGYTLPPKIHISQQDGDYYNVMPCIYERGNLAMVKMIGRHGHENRIMDLFRQDPDVYFVLCDTYEEVIGGSDLVISAITKVTENFVTDEYFKEGCTVIPICTMGFQNCDLFFDRVFTDEMEQIRGFRYFDHFAPVTTNVTDVLNGAAPGRTDNVQRILVYNYGIAIHDLVFAANIYGRAAVPDTPSISTPTLRASSTPRSASPMQAIKSAPVTFFTASAMVTRCQLGVRSMSWPIQVT